MSRVSRQTAIRVIYWNFCALLIIIGLAVGSVTRKAHRFDALILEISREYGMDPLLISAVIWKESRFNPAAIGAKGEIGLMQVTEGAGKDWAKAENVALFTKSDLFDPVINVRVGTWYLRRAKERWSRHKDPLPYALAEYNAGRERVIAWDQAAGPKRDDFMKAIDIPLTRRYIQDILKRYRGGV